MSKVKDGKERIMDKKWERLEKEGISRPRDAEENRKRAQEAHVPRDVVGR